MTIAGMNYFPLQPLRVPRILNSFAEIEGLNVTVPTNDSHFHFFIPPIIFGRGQRLQLHSIKDGKWVGYNTDVIGFEKSFSSLLKPQHKKALVLGNGGAAEAVVYVLKKLAIDFILVSRELHDNSSLTYAGINEQVMKECNIIINTTPLGMYPNEKSCPSILPIRLSSIFFTTLFIILQTLFCKREELGAEIKMVRMLMDACRNSGGYECTLRMVFPSRIQ